MLQVFSFAPEQAACLDVAKAPAPARKQRAGGGYRAMTRLATIHRDQLRALCAWVATPVIRSRQFNMTTLTPKRFARLRGSWVDR